MAVKIEHLGIIVQFAYDEESAIGVWQVTPITPEIGPCSHALILYSDGDVALAHIQKGKPTQFEYFDDGNIQSIRVVQIQ